MPDAGDPILAEDFPAFASDTENTSGTTTSTTFTATLTGGTACEVTFVAPTSERVLIIMSAELVNSTTNQSRIGFRVGAGSTPGAGAEILAASELRALKVTGTSSHAVSYAFPVTSGLTAGSTYNVQQQFSVNSASTGTFSRKTLMVVPLP